MFKFELGQLVYYMRDNRVHRATVNSRMKVDNAKTGALNTEQMKIFRVFGPTGEFYATVHGITPVEGVFASKEELLKSL